MFVLCCIFFPFSFFSVSLQTMKWQLLFPRQPCANHDGETRLRPPLEENETRRQSKYKSPEGERERERRNKKKEDADRDRRRQAGKKIERYKVCEDDDRQKERQTN